VIVGAFISAFLLFLAITVAGMLTLSRIRGSIRFLERAGDFEVQLLEARRYEKNFFHLHATNWQEAYTHLDEALEHVEQARTILSAERGAAHGSNYYAVWERAQESLDRYGRLLAAFAYTTRTKGDVTPEKVEQVRSAARRVTHDAAVVVDRERSELDRRVNRALLAAGWALLVGLVSMTGLAVYATHRVVKPINRFVEYTHRIAGGDFSPITPTRPYRDEFSTLALAFNVMLRELQARQEQLTQAGKLAAMGTLTSGIAHELNNPLNNISLTTEALLEGIEHDSPERMRDLLEQIFTQVERASGTVRNLLDFTRREQPLFMTVWLPDVVGRAAQLVANEARLSQVEVSIELPDDLPAIKACARNIEQILLNLFLNAIQAMPEGGKLRVSASRVGNEAVRIDVADTGQGIPEGALERVFEPFFTTKEVGVGTGLGLTVTHRLVEDHGGQIEVKSNPGQGTTFSVCLPVKGPSSAAS
jgi:signal transduction histidine kinase